MTIKILGDIAKRVFQLHGANERGKAILKDQGVCPQDLEHRQVKYLNNLIEADHGKLKRLIKPTLGFKSLRTAYATLKGFEVMRMFKKGQMDMWKYGQGLKGEIRLINQQFNVYSA